MVTEATEISGGLGARLGAAVTVCENGPQGFHLRDDEGVCVECGEGPFGYAAEHTELLLHEPPPSSIIIAEGPTGTAWQRFRSDGSWHSTTGRRSTWDALMSRDRPGSRVRLVYVPPSP